MSRSTRYAEEKQFLVEMFGGKCQECGYNRNIWALQFHHIDSSEKDIWGELTGRKGSVCFDEVNHYPERFKILCANCHFEHHHRIHAEKNTRICKECGNPFVASSAKEKEGKDKYCSKPCYQTFRLKHAGTPEGVRKRIDKKIDKTGQCWTWKAAEGKQYSHLYTVYTYPDGRHVYMPARVIVLYAYEGVEPDKNRNITMKCDGRYCVNPSHMNITRNTKSTQVV